MANAPPTVMASQMDNGDCVLAKASHSPNDGSSRSKPLSTAAFSKREAIPDDKEQGMGDSGGSACLSTGF